MFFFRQSFLLTASTSLLVRGFVPSATTRLGRSSFTATTYPFAASSTSSLQDEVNAMRASAIKQELQSYGIDTRSFLEKKELVEALVTARKEGKTPKTSGTSASTSTSSKAKKDDATKDDSRSREDRIKEEMEKLKSMKATEMKKELQSMGVSTASFFEKSEFQKALAEARVDGVGGDNEDEEVVEYAKVEVLTDDASGPRQQQPQQEKQSPFGGGGSPFGGGANPFGGGGGASPFGDIGGMGGMGGIGDLLKNMAGGGGGGGGSPFGGAGGNPFGGMGGMGDAMGKAQEMMKNPKVQEIMRKAQSNPKIMSKITECMGNPAAFAKYQNDPEVAEILAELKKAM